MKITVITVCRNAGHTLADTLQSVSAQSHQDVEHLLIDGASTDGTLEIAQRFGTHLANLISEPDLGIYDAMNKGLARARGDLVCFLNADDFYARTDVLETVAKRYRDSQLDAVFADACFIKPGSKRTVRRYNSGRFSPARIRWGWMPAHPALFVKRSVFEQVGPFRTDYRIAGDFEWVARAFSSLPLKYAYLPEVLVNMRLGGASTKGWRNTIVLNKEVLRACRENGMKTNMLMLLSKYPLKFLELAAG